MQIRGLKPEVEQRLRDIAAEQGIDLETKPTLDDKIAAFMANRRGDEWTKQTVRRVLEEDAEFFEMLGDR